MSLWYKAGTVTVNNGSATVTGAGTEFINNVKLGEEFRLEGGTQGYEIVGIVSNTSLTIDPEYLGSNASGEAYRIVPTKGPLQEAYEAFVSALAMIQSHEDGALSGLFSAGTAGSPGVANTGDTNTGIYWPSADQIAAATNGIKRWLLSSTAFQVDVPITGTAVVTNENTATSGRVIKEGAGGLLETGAAPTANDANAATAGGHYMTADLSAATNWPSWFSTGPGSLSTIPSYNSSNKSQLAMWLNETRLAFRTYRAGVWGDWKKVAMEGVTSEFLDITGRFITADKSDNQWAWNVIAATDRTDGTVGFKATNEVNTLTLDLRNTLALLRNTEKTMLAGDGDYLTLYGGGTEAMRIDASRNVGVGTTPAAKFHVEQSGTETIAYFNGANAAFSGNQLTLDMDRAANSVSKFIACYSGGTSDLEFKVSGDGIVTSDGTIAGGGADRAECFERHPDWFALVGGADMRGVPVVLDYGFIRPALVGEAPIGVISDTYDSLGNAAPLKWADQYLKDDLGSYLWEDYDAIEWVETLTETTTGEVQATGPETRTRDVIEIENGAAVKRTITETVQVPLFDEYPLTDEVGADLGTHSAPRMVEVETVTEREIAHSYAADALPEGVTVPEDATTTTQSRKVLNPSYDPAVEYTGRIDRPEWDAVGLLGICRVLSGSPVSPNWIKLRDISASVEEWFIYPGGTA